MMTDYQVLQTVAKHGPNAPALWSVSHAQWTRVQMKLEIIEETLRACGTREGAIAILRMNPMFASTGCPVTRMVA
jgi:hypothetical protein